MIENSIKPGTRLIVRDIKDEMENAFIDYSMSVITARALPDVRDGLKPVHRRILYTMYERGNDPSHPYRKSADTVGAVLGSYHPHGDASVYDAMVRLAQDFSLRYPLVDGQGNFGSVDGDPPAAYRYTEARMSKMAVDLLTDIEKDTIDMVPNFDESKKEPSVLPCRVPNLLINGSNGIAVGMATNIPPHNLCEVIDALSALIHQPEIELVELMEYVHGPDFPTGGIIMGRSGIRAAYATGRGKITLRGRAEIVEQKNGRFQIIITELPYMVNKARLLENIADLAKEKRIEGIADLNDESNRQGMRVVVELKREANPQVVLNQLYRYTQLQDTVGVIMLALDKGVPKLMSLKDMLQKYLEFQEEVVRRRTEHDLKKAKERAHVLEGLRRAVDLVDEIIATIRACKGGKAEAKSAIMEKFEFDDVQATAIVNFQLGQLAGLEILKIDNELGELQTKIGEWTDLLSDSALDGAGVALAVLDGLPNLGGLLGALSALHVADGAHHAAAGTVDLGDAQTDLLLEQLAHGSATGQAGLRGGHKDPDALDGDHHAALVLLGDHTFHHGVLLLGLLDVVPALHAVQTLLGEGDHALLIVDAHDIGLDLIAHFDQVLHLGGGVVGQLGHGYVAGVLGAQIHIDLGGGDASYDTGDLLSCMQSFDRFLQHFSKGFLDLKLDLVAHFVIDLLYNPPGRGCARGDSDRSLPVQGGRFQLLRILDPEDCGTQCTAQLIELTGVRAFSVTDDHHNIALSSQCLGGFLPFTRSTTYCIKNFEICTLFFCFFYAGCPCLSGRGGLDHHGQGKMAVLFVTGKPVFQFLRP